MGPIDKVALALSDGIRLRILDLLAAGRTGACCSPTNPDAPVAICSCDLLPALGVAPSRLSYHMNQLKEAGLVSEQKRGRWVYYTLNRGALMDFAAALRIRFIDRPSPVPGGARGQGGPVPIKLELESTTAER